MEFEAQCRETPCPQRQRTYDLCQPYLFLLLLLALSSSKEGTLSLMMILAYPRHPTQNPGVLQKNDAECVGFFKYCSHDTLADHTPSESLKGLQ